MQKNEEMSKENQIKREGNDMKEEVNEGKRHRPIRGGIENYEVWNEEGCKNTKWE